LQNQALVGPHQRSAPLLWLEHVLHACGRKRVPDWRFDPVTGDVAAPTGMVRLAAMRTGSQPPGLRTPAPGREHESSLKIAIVDESPIRAAILEDGLREAGFSQVERIAETRNLLARIYAIDPDVILIDLESPSRDMLEQMFQMSRAVKRPVAMFVDQSDSAAIQAAVDAGVSAYIVGGLQKERVTPILDLCISRFNAFARLQAELDHAKNALEERKVIDRAKGVLMQAKQLSEGEAYALLRKTAMNENKKIAEIAQSVLTAAELFK
jgi:two-component system, response regulator / RNA-binding antiterminator